MALSDCPRCWNTPCTCGYMGYSVRFHDRPSPCEQDQERERNERIIRGLRVEVERLKRLVKERLGEPPGSP